MIDATYLEAHWPASCLCLKKGAGRLIGLTKAGLVSKLHAVTVALGRSVGIFIIAPSVSDYVGARALTGSLPQADWLLADRGFDADWFHNSLKEMKIEPCIPLRDSRKKVILNDKARYKLRHKIKNTFGKLKEWRRIATRYDMSPELFLLAIVLFLLRVLRVEKL